MHIDPTAPNGTFALMAQAFAVVHGDAMYDESIAQLAHEQVEAIVEQVHRIPADTSDEDRAAVLLREISERASRWAVTTVGDEATDQDLTTLQANPGLLTALMKEVSNGAVMALLVAALDLLAQREPVTR